MLIVGEGSGSMLVSLHISVHHGVVGRKEQSREGRAGDMVDLWMLGGSRGGSGVNE